MFSTTTPQSTETFTVDGQVAGIWKWRDGAIEVSPFGRLSRESRAELDAEAERVAALHA